MNPLHLPRFHSLLVRVVLGSALLSPGLPASAAPSPYGLVRVAEYQLSAEQLDAFRAHKASPPPKGEAPIVAAMQADTVDWFGDILSLYTSSNPYTVVVKVNGRAQGDGDVATLWQVGWRLADGQSRAGLLPGLASSGAKAGERLELVGKSPFSFKEPRAAAPYLGLVEARNIDFEGVTVEVWSGMGKSSWVEHLLSFQALLVGLVFFGLVWWFRLRR